MAEPVLAGGTEAVGEKDRRMAARIPNFQGADGVEPPQVWWGRVRGSFVREIFREYSGSHTSGESDFDSSLDLRLSL